MLSFFPPSALCVHFRCLDFVLCKINCPETPCPTGRPSFLEGCHTLLCTNGLSVSPELSDLFTPNDLAEGQWARGHWPSPTPMGIMLPDQTLGPSPLPWRLLSLWTQGLLAISFLHPSTPSTHPSHPPIHAIIGEHHCIPGSFQVVLVVKNPSVKCRKLNMRHEFDPWVRKFPWRRAWQPTPVFLPGESMDRGVWWASVHRVTQRHGWNDLAHTHRMPNTALSTGNTLVMETDQES